jgi:hypothetical protein
MKHVKFNSIIRPLILLVVGIGIGVGSTLIFNSRDVEATSNGIQSSSDVRTWNEYTILWGLTEELTKEPAEIDIWKVKQGLKFRLKMCEGFAKKSREHAALTPSYREFKPVITDTHIRTIRDAISSIEESKPFSRYDSVRQEK